MKSIRNCNQPITWNIIAIWIGMIRRFKDSIFHIQPINALFLFQKWIRYECWKSWKSIKLRSNGRMKFNYHSMTGAANDLFLPGNYRIPIKTLCTVGIFYIKLRATIWTSQLRNQPQTTIIRNIVYCNVISRGINIKLGMCAKWIKIWQLYFQ